MSTHVIILAQGTQSRMGDSTGGLPKQLLSLPACGNHPILLRTLRQLKALHHHHITVVAWPEIHKALYSWDGPPSVARHLTMFDAVTLPDPGNSSLKGLARYLEQLELTVRATKPDRTIVLLGDVVYSWACLRALMDPAVSYRFVGTSDISPSAGELWGVSFDLPGTTPVMLEALRQALAAHPPFEAYQPGQMRRWLWAVTRYVSLGQWTQPPKGADWYHAIDDYTMDVDLPEHVEKLDIVSSEAALDDREHGVTW